MTSNRTTSTLVALFVIVATACGTSESNTETANSVDDRPDPTTSIAGTDLDDAPKAPDVDTAPPAPPAPSNDNLASNPNDPSTPMGALCWTRWEVARLQLQTVLNPDDRTDDLPAVSRDTYAAVANAEAVRRVADRSALPADVRTFADGLTAEIDQRANGPDTSPPIDFEKLPAAAAYAETAADDPGCKQP